MEFSLITLRHHFLSPIIHPTSPRHSLHRTMSIHLHIDRLLIAYDSHRHRNVILVDLLPQESLHLGLDRVIVSVFNEATSEVHAGHGVEVFVLAGVAAEDFELGGEYVCAVGPVGDTVVYNHLNQYFFGCLAIERHIFSIAFQKSTILTKPLLNSSTMRSLMLNKALLPNIFHMLLTRFSQLIIPSQLLSRLLLL